MNKFKYIQIINNVDSEPVINIRYCDINEFLTLIDNYINLNQQYRAEEDEPNILFLGSKTFQESALPMFGLLNKNKVCGDLYNSEFRIFSVNSDGKLMSMTDSTSKYFQKVYSVTYKTFLH